MFQQLLIVVGILASAFAENDWPIIGIFAQPTTSTASGCGGSCTYIAASYVKYLESAGARVVPIDYYASHSVLDKHLSTLNGFFFPGGSSSFPSSAQYVFDQVKAKNDAGVFTPLWGTCMGFEWLLIAASKDQSILDPKSGQMDAYNYSIPLDFTSAASSSRLFAQADDRVMKILSGENVTMNNHHYGIWADHFASTSSLSKFYDVISTNKDRQGSEFVSTMEAFNYPIYGSQWHPEKNGFEWGKTDGVPNEAINHSPDAVAIAQYTANFFVSEARKNNNKFSSPDDEDAALIYNYKPTKTTGSFVQEYFFHF